MGILPIEEKEHRMIRGHYYFEGARADLIRPLDELPRRDGERVTIITKSGRRFDCNLEVTASGTTLCCKDFRQMTEIVGWFYT